MLNVKSHVNIILVITTYCTVMLSQTFRPNRKSFAAGTLRYSLHQQANASLHSGLDLKQVVQLPAGEDLNEWIAVHG